MQLRRSLIQLNGEGEEADQLVVADTAGFGRTFPSATHPFFGQRLSPLE
jgi:hypothetical protein